jgi:hypothetical protein
VLTNGAVPGADARCLGGRRCSAREFCFRRRHGCRRDRRRFGHAAPQDAQPQRAIGDLQLFRAAAGESVEDVLDGGEA